MTIKCSRNHRRAQAAVEYIVLLGVVTAVVLAGFNSFLYSTQERTNLIINQALKGIMGVNAISKARSTHLNYP